MRFKGTAERGKSLIYREPYAGELRLTNLTPTEVEETIEQLGKPDDICNSRPQKRGVKI